MWEVFYNLLISFLLLFQDCPLQFQLPQRPPVIDTFQLNEPYIQPDLSNPLSNTLTILSYNDVYSMTPVEKNGRLIGGASRVAHLIEEIHANQDANALVLFSGDTLSPSLWSTIFKGMHMIETHNILKCDYACLGNHEFDFGMDVLVEAIEKSHFVWLNSNAYETNTKKLIRGTVPRAIKTVNNIRVGLFGVMYDMDETSTGAFFKDPIEAGQKQVRALKEEGAQVIIALTHQAYRDDDKFATQVEGVDLILGGHDHRTMSQTSFRTPYLKSDMDFRNVWLTTLRYEQEPTPNVELEYRNIPITGRMESDAQVDQMIEVYTSEVGHTFDDVLGQAVVDLDFSQDIVRYKESAMGNFIADGMRTAYNRVAKAGIINGGGIRTDSSFKKGPITYADVLGWCPFRNTVFQVEITGKFFKEYLTSILSASCGTKQIIAENGDYMHPSGFKYIFRCTGVNKGSFSQLNWLSAASNSPIQDKEKFILALPNFSYLKSKRLFEKYNVPVILGEKDAMAIDLALRKEVIRVGDVHPLVEGRSSIRFEDKK